MNPEVPAERPPHSPVVVLGILTGLNGLNYLDRYVGAAILPVILTSLALSDAAGGFLQSVLIVVYAAIPVGTALGYIVGGLVGGAFGWRAAFLVAGAPGGVLALLLLFLADPPRGRLDAQGDPAGTPLGLGPSIGALLARPS